VTIDLDALAANYRLLTTRAGGNPPAGMVKADAYGLGAGPVARRLVAEGCNRLFVARLDEGLEVRAALNGDATSGRDADPVRILVLDGVVPGTEGELLAARLTPVLNDLAQVERWRAAARSAGRPLDAALHFDTGMTRLGIPAGGADRLAADPGLLDGLAVDVVMSHLASADVPASDHPAQQLRRFLDLRARFPQGLASLANSSAVFLGPEYHFDLVRPGIALYGGAPQPDCRPNPMAPVVTVEAPVVQVQRVEAGIPVGYGATHRTEAATRLATVPVGYADGFLRAAGRARFVAIGERTVPVVGRVSMDLIIVDVGEVPDALVGPGTPVEVLGRRRLLDDVAAEAGTIANEILTGLGRRYERVYLDSDR
jgi:alanine racemase